MGEAGDAIGAYKLATAVVEDAQRMFGADDRYILVTRSDLVRWAGEAGDVTSARELAATLVEDHERVLGPDHRYTVLARAGLARWTGEVGDVAHARELATAVLADLARLTALSTSSNPLTRIIAVLRATSELAAAVASPISCPSVLRSPRCRPPQQAPM